MCTNGNTAMPKELLFYVLLLLLLFCVYAFFSLLFFHSIDAVAVLISQLLVSVCGLLRNAEFRTHIALFIRLIDSVWFVRNIYFMPFELDANSSKRVSKSFVSFRLIWFFLRFTMLFIKTIKIFVSFLFTATPLNGMKHLYHIHSITMHWKQQYFDNSFSRLRLNRPN